MAISQILRAGDTSKLNPVTIVVVANPSLEAPWNSGTFVVDPITANQPAFNACVQYIDTALFGGLPGQKELFLGDPSIAPNIRVVSLFVTGLPAVDQNSLVGQDSVSNLLIARRARFASFLSNYGLSADVVYAVSGSTSHGRASAWFTSDDDGRPGVNFVLDGVTLSHRHYNLVPGTVALHLSSTSLTALHEFGHALSSYSNGTVVDLYVDSGPGLNNKRSRPIPAGFAVYDAATLAADAARDGLGYPSTWQSYHCELNAPASPAVMDNYWLASSGLPEDCQHDRITREFLLDRVRAKMIR